MCELERAVREFAIAAVVSVPEAPSAWPYGGDRLEAVLSRQGLRWTAAPRPVSAEPVMVFGCQP